MSFSPIKMLLETDGFIGWYYELSPTNTY